MDIEIVTTTRRGRRISRHTRPIHGKPASAYSARDWQTLLCEGLRLHVLEFGGVTVRADIDDCGNTALVIASRLGETRLSTFPTVNVEVLRHVVRDTAVFSTPLAPMV
jgi:hypothetical protein